MSQEHDDVVVAHKVGDVEKSEIELVTIKSEHLDNGSVLPTKSPTVELTPNPEDDSLAPPVKPEACCCQPGGCLYNDWNTLPQVNPCCSSPERPCCVKGESCMERAFEGIGVEVAKRPWVSMVVSFIILLACSAGYGFIEDENRPDKLWIPTGSPALFHKEYVDDTWPAGQRLALYIATCADVEEDEPCNILEARYIEELARINAEIKAITVDTNHALEIAGVPLDTPTPYAANYTFEGDEDANVAQLCFLLGSTGAVCGESSVLETFRNDVPPDLTNEGALETINFYPTQLGFCPLTISDPESPCRNTTAYNTAAAYNDCQVFTGTDVINDCRISMNNYCNEKCPNWLATDEDDRLVDCEEESCTRSSWYLYRTETIPTFLVDLDAIMSSGPDGPTYDEQDEVVSAEALFGYFMLSTQSILVSGTELDPVAEEWEKAALCKLGIVADSDDPLYNDTSCVNDSPLLRFTAQFQRSLGDEFGAEILGDIPLIGGSFGIVIVYLIVMLSRRDYVHSMIGMSIVCIMTVGLAYAGCIGLGTFIGLKNNNLNLNIPFLLLGLGVDDAFVISAEFFRATTKYPTMPVQQRTVYAAKYGGVSVLITSATDALAFLVGSSTVLPALSWFCAFCGIGIIMCFALQLFLFLPALQINAMRAEANYLDLWCCCQSRRRHKFEEPLGCCGCCKAELCPPGILGKIFGGIGRGVTSVAGLVISFIVFLGLLGVGIYGSTLLYKDFQIEWFVPEDSYLQDFYEQNNYYFQAGVSFTVYTKDIDYFATQSSFTALHERLVSEPYMDVAAGVSDWHHSFMEEQLEDPDQVAKLNCTVYPTVNGTVLSQAEYNCTFTNRTEYFTELMKWYEAGGWNLLSGNLQWRDSSCDVCEGTCALNASAPECDFSLGVNASKISATLLLNATTGGQQRYDTMTELRAMVAECFPTYDEETGARVEGGTGDYNADELAFPYAREFPNWEEVGTIDRELWKNLGICFAVITVIILALIPKPRIAIWVIIAIVMSIVDILGFLYYWGITISGVSTIFVLVSVGLAVDYSAHIAHMFAESEGVARDRAVEALSRIGPSVFNAIFSTLLAVIVLASSSSFIYQVFFKVLCLTVLFAGAHGLWFLPVLLAVGGGDNLPDNEASVCGNAKVSNEKEVEGNLSENTKQPPNDDVAKLEEGDSVTRSTETA